MSVEFRYQATGAAGQMVNGRLPAASEAEAVRLAAKGLPLVCVNPSMALGPGENPEIAAVCERLLNGEALGEVPGFPGDGEVRLNPRAAFDHLLAKGAAVVG